MRASLIAPPDKVWDASLLLMVCAAVIAVAVGCIWANWADGDSHEGYQLIGLDGDKVL